MAAKSTDWRPGPTVCRCCLSEGCYKDISTEYFWMGKREVYAEMLLDAFNLTISYAQSGPNSNSRLICEPCISRLRDASDFKRQVQECEKTFTQYLDPGNSSINDFEVEVPLEQLDSQVKVEQVKIEREGSDDDDFDDRAGFDDDDDDMDDQPLTKLASKVPKKESVDLLDLLDNAKGAVKRKSSTKTKSSPAKKSKTTKKEVKATTSKTVKLEKKKKEVNPMTMARRNAKIIVRYTTAFPFRLPKDALACVYCEKEYEEPSAFRDHMRHSHPDVLTRVAFSHIPEGYIKVDCTELNCRICSETFHSIEEVAKHLLKAHNKEINFKHDLGVQSFIFHGDMWTCAICNAKSATLRSLSRHTQSHYQKYTCKQCGKSYFSSGSLRRHSLVCQLGNQRMCIKCKKTFKTLEDRRKHLEETPECRLFRCKDCDEKFITAEQKMAHQSKAHGRQNRSYVCPECREIFPNRNKYRSHFVITHTSDYFSCTTCGMKFTKKSDLERHIVSHTNEKLFPCPSCPKRFSRKINLVQHSWIHSEVKRFECVPCNKKFNQRVSYKTHMKSYHPNVEIS